MRYNTIARLHAGVFSDSDGGAMTEARPVHHDSDSHLANDDDQHYELEMNHEATHSVTEPKLLKKAKKGSLFGALFSRTLPQCECRLLH